MKDSKIKPTSSDLKNKAISTARLLRSYVHYDVEAMAMRVEEIYLIDGKGYSHSDVIPLTEEQIAKLSIDIPTAVVKAKFKVATILFPGALK